MYLIEKNELYIDIVLIRSLGHREYMQPSSIFFYN